MTIEIPVQIPSPVPVTGTRALKIMWSWSWRFYLLISPLALGTYWCLQKISEAELDSSPILNFLSDSSSLFENPIATSIMALILFLGWTLITMPFEIYTLKRVFNVTFKDFRLGFNPEIPFETPVYRHLIRAFWWHYKWRFILFTICLVVFSTIIEICLQKDFDNSASLLAGFSCIILHSILLKGRGSICLYQASKK